MKKNKKNIMSSSFCNDWKTLITVRASRDFNVMLFTLFAVRAFCFKYRTWSKNIRIVKLFFFKESKVFLTLHLLVPNREAWRVWQVPRQRIRREWQSQTEKSVCSKNYLATLTWDYLVTHTWALSSAIFASTFSSFAMSAVARPRSHSCWFWEASKELWNCLLAP